MIIFWRIWLSGCELPIRLFTLSQLETSGTARHKEPVDQLSRSYTPVSATTSPTMDLMIRIPAIVSKNASPIDRVWKDNLTIDERILIIPCRCGCGSGCGCSNHNSSINKMGRRTLFLQSFPRSVSEGSTAWLSWWRPPFCWNEIGPKKGYLEAVPAGISLQNWGFLSSLYKGRNVYMYMYLYIHMLYIYLYIIYTYMYYIHTRMICIYIYIIYI